MAAYSLHANTIWLNWTGPGGATPSTGAFASLIGGTATATRGNAVDGGFAAGIPGPQPSSISNTTGTFQSFYGTNPVSFLSNSYNDTADRYSVDVDFTGLTGGVLPSNVLFGLVDYDSSEVLANLTAYTTGGVQVTTPWLAMVSGQAGYLDVSFADLFDESASMSVPAPLLSVASGVYQFVSSPINMTVGFNAFRTTVPITRITFDHSMNTGPRIGGGGGGIAIGLNSEVPEPGAWSMMLLGGAAIAVAKRRMSA
jgi:hypothetical protein